MDYRWIGLRGPREAFIKQTKKGLEIEPFETEITELKPTSTLFHRQMHKTFSFKTDLTYTPKSDEDFAGITALQNERFNYAFGVTKKGKEYYVVLQRTEKGESTIIASEKIDLDGKLSLKVEGDNADYKFSYATDGAIYKTLGGSVSGDILSTNIAGGFTGALMGLYATSNNSIEP